MGLGELTDNDKAVIREIARTVAREILIEHESHCSMRWRLQVQWWKWMALSAGAGTAGGLIVKLLGGLG